MGLYDVLRDTNSWNMEQAVSGEAAIRAETEKLEHLSDEELWEMHTRLGMLSARGMACKEILKKRFPDQFRR